MLNLEKKKPSPLQCSELLVEDLRNGAVFTRLTLILEPRQVFLTNVITTKLIVSESAQVYGYTLWVITSPLSFFLLLFFLFLLLVMNVLKLPA